MKNKILITVIIILVIFTSVIVINSIVTSKQQKNTNQNIPTENAIDIGEEINEIKLETSRITLAKNVNELIEVSDLIVLATVQPYKENKLIEGPNNIILSGYTLTELKVDKTLSGDDVEQVMITEEYYILDEVINKTLMFQGAYIPAKEGEQYMFFLKAYATGSEYEGYYFPVDLEYGKYLVNDETLKSVSDMSFESLQVRSNVSSEYIAWMSQVLEMYVK